MSKLPALHELVCQSKLRSAALAWAALVLLLVSQMQSPAQGTLVFRFEEPPVPAPGTGRYVQQYFESGMWFRPLGPIGPGNGFMRSGGGGGDLPFFPVNGTAYLQAGFTDSLMFSFTDGSVFNLEAVDIAEYSTVVPEAVVHIMAYRHDGTVVTIDLVVDGIIDGTGPLEDFQTFTFDERFRDLDRVEIPTEPWSLDNLVVSIPEPGGGALLVLGGLALWAARRSKLACRSRRAEGRGGGRRARPEGAQGNAAWTFKI